MKAVTYCQPKQTALLWRYPPPGEHPSSVGKLRCPFEPKPEAIEHMRKHTTKPILPGGGLPTRTTNQFSRYIVTVSAGEPAACLRTEQLYHKSVHSALQCSNRNGSRLRADAVRVAVLSFLRSR